MTLDDLNLSTWKPDPIDDLDVVGADAFDVASGVIGVADRVVVRIGDGIEASKGVVEGEWVGDAVDGF